MGVVLFLLFMFMEIALAVFTLVKQKERKQWLRNRFFTRTVELLLFLLLLITPLVNWSFRFKLCFFVLCIRFACAGLHYLASGKHAQGIKKTAGILIPVTGSIFLLGASLLPAFLFTGYQGIETTGKHAVGKVSCILTDESREELFESDGSKREVPVHVYYPTETEQTNAYPLILFSHGAFGYYESNTSTYMELASHGYVVLALDHPYHSFFTQDTTGKTITVNPEFIQEVFYVNEETTPEEEIFALSGKWLELRKADINFVLDSFITAKQNNDLSDCWFTDADTKEELLQILHSANCDKIGLMGHSLGGAAAVSLGRQRKDIGAVIDLDGTMLGEKTAYENGAYQYIEAPYPVPLLSIVSEEHQKQAEEYAALYVNNYTLEHAKDAKSTYFINAGHMNFTDLPLFSPILAQKLGTGSIDAKHCIMTMNTIILDYMDYYIKNQGEITLLECYQ